MRAARAIHHSDNGCHVPSSNRSQLRSLITRDWLPAWTLQLLQSLMFAVLSFAPGRRDNMIVWPPLEPGPSADATVDR
jgi:hypothetical protein